MKRAAVSTILMLLILIACTSEAEEPQEVWSQDETFQVDERTFYGKEGKFAIVKENGNENEPAFPAGPQGRHYSVYFWGESDELIGKTYTLTATHEEADESVTLYEWRISGNNSSEVSADASSGAKFGLDKAGLWLMEVTVEGEEFASFIIEAK
ncbi:MULTISPECIES: hypothetical protein [Thalassobacillus]|uniref:hypothetical protein n=1 Tax=Thalassobacillus TaxID=331971 RepID=UPI000A1CC10D|nr:hypothetical protein [Thalassobacillus devorans]